MNTIYTGHFKQVFTAGKFKGIVIENQSIAFSTHDRFNWWVEEINKKHGKGKLNYYVEEVK